MILKTKRLILRPFRKSDWKDIVEGVSNINVSKMTTCIPHPYSKKDAQKFISEKIGKWKKKNKKDYTFLIELKSEKKVIGGTTIFNIAKLSANAETGSWINKKYWRRGFILESKVPVLDFAFNKLKLRRIYSLAFVDNKASNSMSKKLGFAFEGTLRKHGKAISTGKIHDVNLYGLLKEEWVKIRQKIIKDVDNKIKNDKKPR